MPLLTCHLAYLEALKYQDITFTPYWVEHINRFTPTITADSDWSCVFMNAMFCEAMYRQNPIRAVGLMEEAGVSYDAIKDLAHQFKALPQVDTHKAIAPPTFTGTPEKWRKRGYEIELHEATEGDLVVTNNIVGWFVDVGPKCTITVLSGHVHQKVSLFGDVMIIRV